MSMFDPVFAKNRFYINSLLILAKSLKWIILVFFFSTIQLDCYGQDPLYSQFYNAPINLNPSFVGLTGAGRTGINYRIQGTSDNARFTTRSFYADYFVEDYNLSTGISLIQDKSEINGFNNITLIIPLSYQFQINEKLVIKPSIQGSYNSRSIDFGNLIFGDALDASGNVIGQSNESLLFSDKINYFDLGIGLLTYTENFWFGISLNNLLNQNISFIEGSKSNLPIRISTHLGYRHLLHGIGSSKKEHSLMPLMNYTRFGNTQQLDFGVIGVFGPMVGGLTYRGIPIDGSNKQAITPMLGLKIDDLNFAYSFDFVLDNTTDRGGIHEISLSYNFNLNPNDPAGRKKKLKCPIINY